MRPVELSSADIRRHAIGMGLAIIVGVYTLGVDLWIGPVLQEAPAHQGQLLAFICGVAFLLSATFINRRPGLAKFLLIVGGLALGIYAVGISTSNGTFQASYDAVASIVPAIVAIVAGFLIGPVDRPDVPAD